MGAALLGAAVTLITWPIKAMIIRRVNDQKSHKIVCFCAKIGLLASFLVDSKCGKTFGQLHHGHLRYRAWYRWKACRKSFLTVPGPIEKVGVVQKIQ